MSRVIIGVVCGLTVLGAQVWAAEDDQHRHRQAQAHVHGMAALAAALDGSQLVIEVTSPVWNILGFEHAPETEAERAALHMARETLLNGEAMMIPARPAQCSFQGADLSWGESAPGNQEGRHDGHDHGHHRHDSTADDGVSLGFRDMVVTYRFDCAAPLALTTLSTGLFTAFDRLSAIKASFLSDQAQAGATLSDASPRFDLK